MRKWLAKSILIAVPAIAFAGPGVWTSGGPHGGIVYSLKFNPSVPTTIYANTGGGLFKTTNRGASWSRAESGLAGLTLSLPFVVDADSPSTLYAFSNDRRLYRTTDSALNWAPTGYMLPADTTVTSITDVPGVSNQVFISLGVNTDINGTPLPVAGTMVLRSIDSGATFAAAGTGLPADVGFSVVSADPTNANRMLAGLQPWNNGTPPPLLRPMLFRSINGGTTWTSVLSEPTITADQPGVTSISFGAASTAYIVGGSDFDTYVYRSDDDGGLWAKQASTFGFVSAHPTVAMEVWLGKNQSTNGGASFAPQVTDLTANATYLDALGNQVTASVNEVVFDPNYPAAGTFIWAPTQGAGVMRRPVAGTAWSGTSINNGLAAASLRSLAINPNPSTASGSGAQLIFAGFTDGVSSSPGLYQSVDGAASWLTSNDGLQAAALRTLTIDPLSAGTSPGAEVSSIIYAGGRSALSPLAARNSSLYRSRNNGISWTRMDGNLPTRTIGATTFVDIGTSRDTELDPRSCVLPIVNPTGPICASGTLHRLYATSSGAPTAGFTHRAMRTDNADTTVLNGAGLPDVQWVALDSTLPPSDNAARITPVNILIDPTNSNRLYIGTFASIITPGTDRASGVFRSDDAGATWVHASGPNGAGGLPRIVGTTNTGFSVLSLAIHPTDGNTLWASVVDAEISPTSGSIYKTINGGVTWTESATGIASRVDIRDLLVDPIAPNILYASGSGSITNPGAVYRSDDGGANWRSISVGLPAYAALALELDPFNSTILHAGTVTGVWSIEQVPDEDGDGIPDGTENNAPNGGDGNGDGTGDALQGAVGSSVVLLRGPGDAVHGAGGFFTSDIISGSGGACAQAVDVQAKLAARNGRDFVNGGPSFFSYPQDLVRFDIQNCAQATVELTFHNANFNQYGWSFRFYGPSTPGVNNTVGWHDFSARATRLGVNKWRLNIQDGQFGSYRPAGINALLFEGGPACNDDRLMQSSFEDAQVLLPSCN